MFAYLCRVGRRRDQAHAWLSFELTRLLEYTMRPR